MLSSVRSTGGDAPFLQTYAYDSLSRLSKISFEGDTIGDRALISYERDNFGRLSKVTRGSPGAETGSATNEFYTSIRYASEESSSLHPDLISSITHYALGNVDGIARYEYAYETTSLIRSLKIRRPGIEDGARDVVYDYIYNPGGEVIKTSTHFPGQVNPTFENVAPSMVGNVQSKVYDSNGRLVRYVDAGDGSDSATLFAVEYDGEGNLVRRSTVEATAKLDDGNG